MIEYRKLPQGNELIGTLGIGTGSLHQASEKEIKCVIEKATQHGINFFDLCAGGSRVYKPFGQAVKEIRKNIYFQLHFGAVYNADGEYGWSRDLNEIKKTFDWEMQQLQTDYVDFGFLHCIDEDNDLQDLINNGIVDFVLNLKKQNIVKHIGFSSHTPSVANKILDMGFVDMMMFSINPAYDLECGDEYGIGTTIERANLFARCQTQGIGISVMKPFHGGMLLSDKTSPFKQAMTKNQCLQYVLDRPAVLVAVPGARSLSDLNELLSFADSTREQNDYSMIAQFTPQKAIGNCVYCNHCLPCPAGIDIGLINKYYDLALSGDNIAKDHYGKLAINASCCLQCGHCNSRCPFKVNQQEKMATIANYFIGV